MDEFYRKPILNSPYEYPGRQWELDETGQPTNRILDERRRVALITPIPAPRKQRGQRQLVFDQQAEELETDGQQYDPTPIINDLRRIVDAWRELPANQWQVTPETARLLHHWRLLGANDPYKALKTTLKAEIDRDAWETLHSDTSRPFDRPASGRIAVKVINHLGDEVMKVFRV